MLGEHLQKRKKEYKSLIKQGIHHIFIKKKLEKAFFQHDMAYAGFKNLTIIITSDNKLRAKAFDIAKNPKNGAYQRGLASMVYKFLDRKTCSSDIKNDSISNKELVDQLHKPIIRKLTKRKVHLSVKDNVWGADLALCYWSGNLIKKFVFIMCYRNFQEIHMVYSFEG